jgi:hypothetical protein
MASNLSVLATAPISCVYAYTVHGRCWNVLDAHLSYHLTQNTQLVVSLDANLRYYFDAHSFNEYQRHFIMS